MASRAVPSGDPHADAGVHTRTHAGSECEYRCLEQVHNKLGQETMMQHPPADGQAIFGCGFLRLNSEVAAAGGSKAQIVTAIRTLANSLWQ